MASEQEKRPIYLFYDNQNIWIEGMKELPECQHQDNSWRLIISELLELVKDLIDGEFKLAHLYATCRPSNMQVWKKYERVIECILSKPSAMNGREKEVDNKLISDVLEVAFALAFFRDEVPTQKRFNKYKTKNTKTFQDHCKALKIDINKPFDGYESFYKTIKKSVIVIVSGDLDFKQCIETALSLGIDVHLMCWNRSKSSGLNNFKYTDLSHYRNIIGFREKFWSEPYIPLDRSLVLLNVFDYVDEASRFLNSNPVQSCLIENDKHLVIVRSDRSNANRMTTAELESFLDLARKSISTSSSNIIIYNSYQSSSSPEAPVQVENSYECLADTNEADNNNDEANDSGISELSSENNLVNSSPTIR